jgi:hypothetical protein
MILGDYGDVSDITITKEVISGSLLINGLNRPVKFSFKYRVSSGKLFINSVATDVAGINHFFESHGKEMSFNIPWYARVFL